jgi:hypothetical protein
MLINDLKTMEDIVAKNNNLIWDGWNVVHLFKSNVAMFKTNGVFIDGNWYTKTVYSPDQNGWNINKKHLES